MARGYPRFLFSNPQNTKSKGPFLVHTLEPKFIAQVVVKDNQYSGVHLLENWSSLSDDELWSVIDDANYWLFRQIKMGEIKL